MSHAIGGEMKYGRLKRTAIIGYAAVFAWYGIVGGYMTIRSQNSFGWVALVLGIGVMTLPFIPAVRGYADTLAANRSFPALVFIPNILIVLMFAYLASIYIGDPYLAYNEQETLAGLVFAGAALLAAATLVVNTIAYLMDRRT